MRRRLSIRQKIFVWGWWMVHITVHMPLSHKSFKVLIKDRAVAESRPDVGSSRKSSLGRMSSSIATHKRFLSPPEMPLLRVSPTMTSRQYSIPTVFSASSTRSFRSSKGVPLGNRRAAVYLWQGWVRIRRCCIIIHVWRSWSVLWDLHEGFRAGKLGVDKIVLHHVAWHGL